MGNELALMQQAAAATSLTLEHLKLGAANADGGGATPRTALTSAILHSMDYGRQLGKAGGRWELVRVRHPLLGAWHGGLGTGATGEWPPAVMQSVRPACGMLQGRPPGQAGQGRAGQGRAGQ